MDRGPIANWQRNFGLSSKDKDLHYRSCEETSLPWPARGNVFTRKFVQFQLDESSSPRRWRQRSWLTEWIEDAQAWPIEILGVARDDGEIMPARNGGNKAVSERHLPARLY